MTPLPSASWTVLPGRGGARAGGGRVPADRWRRHKELAITGYAPVGRVPFAHPAGRCAWSSITAIIVVDRIGKGIRTAPRDALISQRSERSQLATAFGVHRALDAVGAMLGPVVAFLLLPAPDEFDVVFVNSFAIGGRWPGVIGCSRRPPQGRPGSHRRAADLPGRRACSPSVASVPC